MKKEIDISENELLRQSEGLLQKLLLDHTTQKNIFWATDDYATLGEEFYYYAPITIDCITGKHGSVIQPRVLKTKEEQINRTKDKAEVFTPSWVCNIQNNLIDEAWFGRKDVFNPSQRLGVQLPNLLFFPKIGLGKTMCDLPVWKLLVEKLLIL